LTPVTTATVVVPVYGDDPWLERCAEAVLASTGVDVDLVLVDNGGPAQLLDRLASQQAVQVVRPGHNLGYAGGCNLGATHAGGDVVVLLNQDAVVEPEAVARLAAAALRPGVGVASASVRLADAPGTLNSGGNEIHFLGFGWAGAFGEDAARHADERDVTSASGTALAVRRSLWRDLGGLAEPYFAYHEDAELSWRCWQRGERVVYVPDAVVVHRYEFSRNAAKYELLERNRLAFVLTAYQGRTLLLLALPLVAAEIAVTALAVAQGWFGPKVAGWRWLFANRRWLRRRRALLQGERVTGDRDLAPLLAPHLRAENLTLPAAARPLDGALALYWRLVARLL
jgi:GT2 family glycosyltransferase